MTAQALPRFQFPPRRFGTGTAAFAAYYAATPAERQAAAARLIHVLEAGRRRTVFRLAESYAQLPLDWKQCSDFENMAVWLMRVVEWLRERYALPRPPDPKTTAALVDEWEPRWQRQWKAVPVAGDDAA